MFRLVSLSWLLVTVLCASSHAEEKPDLVFLLIGQSNMAGRAHLEDGDDAAIPGVFLLNADGKWEAARNPLNRYATDRKVISMQRIGPGDAVTLADKRACERERRAVEPARCAP